MKKKWILIAVCVVIILFSLLAIGGDDSFGTRFASRFGDAMDWKSRWLAGGHSVNCGRVEVKGDPREATKCALQAQAESKPFRVVYNIMGYDAPVAGGIVRTADGELYALSLMETRGAGVASRCLGSASPNLLAPSRLIYGLTPREESIVFSSNCLLRRALCHPTWSLTDATFTNLQLH